MGSISVTKKAKDAAVCLSVFLLWWSSHPFFAPAVRREVVNRHFDALPFLQLAQDADQQLEVKCVRMVKVVLIPRREFLLLFI